MVEKWNYKDPLENDGIIEVSELEKRREIEDLANTLLRYATGS